MKTMRMPCSFARLLPLAAMLALALPAPAADDPQTYVFDTGKAAGAADVAGRAGWKQLAEDDLTHAFTGDIVLVNNRLAICFRIGGAGAELYSLASQPPRKLTTVATAGGAALTGVKLVENTPAGVQVLASFATNAPVSFRLVPGDAIVELKSGDRAADVLLQSDIRYMLAPNYFGNDLVFAANTLPDTTFTLAMEQLYLNLLGDGNAIMMVVCETAGQTAGAQTSGTGADRTFTGTTVQLPVGKKAWVAFLEDKGIWAAVPAGTAASDWKPPFEANWRVSALAGSGRATSTPWSLTAAGTAERVIYPLERSRTTPVTAYCMRDIMKNTLGVGPCEYIVAAEGLNDSTPHAVTEWVRKQFQKKKEKESADAIKERCQQMVEHVKHSQQRIAAYRALAARVVAGATGLAEDRAAASGALRTLAQMLDAAAESRQSPDEIAADATKLADGIQALIGKADTQAELDRLVSKLQAIGDLQDRSLANCRVSAKWLIARTPPLAQQFPAIADTLRTLSVDAESLIKKGP
jgi:hypothetical protein